MDLSVETQQNIPIISAKEAKGMEEEIICGKRLKFNYINGDKFFSLIKNKNTGIQNKFTHMDILRYNFNQIISQLVNYFPEIKIIKFDNTSCVTECKIKQEQYAYKYDIYLVLNKDDKIYEYGFDFFTSLSDMPENKFTHSKTLLDDYIFYLSEDISSNTDIKYHLNEVLFKLLTTICAIQDDEYQLAEILYVKSNQENKTYKQIIKDLSYFLRIINWKKEDKIDLEDLYDECMFIDKKINKSISYEKFKETLSKICCKNNVKYNIDNKIIYFELFEEIILNISEHYQSSIIDNYKIVYKKAIKLLMESLKIIISMVKEINRKKTFTPEYINNLIMFHMDEYINQKPINEIYNKRINKFKNFFEEILEDCDNCDYFNVDEEYEENKFSEIKQKLNILYSNIYYK